MRVWGKRSSSDDKDDDEDVHKRSWRKNTVRVWGKRQGLTTADRRSWAGNTIRVWGKRLSDGMTPKKILDLAATRYSAAPKRSIASSEARLRDGGRLAPTRLSAESDVDVGTLAGDRHPIATRSKRSSQHRHGGRWMVRRDVSHRPRWVAFRGPKRSWRTNVIRVWGKRAS